MHILKLKPIGKDYLWGGTKLKENYGKNFDMNPLAETWEFSTHPDGLTLVENGNFKGKTLLEVFKSNPELFGDKFKDKKDLPILVKFIDAKNKLSVQVHPNDDYALKFENQNGKSEMWYVLEAEENARLVYGFEHNVTPDILKKSLADGSVEKHLHFEPVKKGDVFFIPAGTVHGIGEGIVVAEIQENSNVTYRVFDYNRVDKNGKKRELHVDKALKVLNMNAFSGKTCQSKLIKYSQNIAYEHLCNCNYFDVHKYTIKGKLNLNVKYDEFSIILCVNGKGGIISGEDNLEINKGDCFFVSTGFEEVMIYGDIEILKINC